MEARGAGYYAFSDRVHHVLIAKELILLDEKRDRYFLLDEYDSKGLILGLTNGEATDAISKYKSAGLIESREKPERINFFPTPRHGVGNHVWANVGSFRNMPYAKFKFLLALLLMVFVKLFVWVLGFGCALRFVRRLMPNAATENCTQYSEISRTKAKEMAAAIYRAGLTLPFKAQCLESSLTLFLYASFASIPNTFKIGVQRYDFLAHAWIEVDGEVIGDDPALKTEMPVILSIEPKPIR